MGKTFNSGERGGNLHKEGIYQAKIQDATVTVSQKSGNDMVKLTLVIYRNGRPHGSLVTDFLTMTDNAIWRWNQLMDVLEAPSNVDIDPETFLPGQEVWVKLIIEEYNDEDQNKVKSYLSEAKAMKQLAAQEDMPEPLPTDGGAKAKQRNRTTSRAAELDAAETMPL